MNDLLVVCNSVFSCHDYHYHIAHSLVIPPIFQAEGRGRGALEIDGN